VDNGQCTHEFDQTCIPGADKRRGERFSQIDNPEAWLVHQFGHCEYAKLMVFGFRRDIKIPTIFVLRKDWDEIIRLWQISPETVLAQRRALQAEAALDEENAKLRAGREILNDEL
jgi:hypothetical protein